MLNPRTIFFLIPVFTFLISCDNTPPPPPIEPVPSTRQLKWHETEFYAFVHFNMNTFTDMEWGFGGESPELFNPSELDCRQWARVCKEAGMKGIILTAKHHDGFCLWPSAYTEHSVKNSPWKNGRGDVVQELADACREYGLKFGLYLSPWDRNHAAYGTDEYIIYFRNQLTELMSNYGQIFEVWFDGANGGTGYYGGANERRHVDRKTYYDWENTQQIVRDLQPDAVMFSDAGPDVRWVGNESGWAGETNWSVLRRDEFYPGSPNYRQLTSGHEDGTHWLPAEVDVSIRPGWYYHASEDHKVRSLKTLTDIYYNSIGRNASFLLNLPVDPRGLVHEKDIENLMKLKEVIEKDFETNLAEDAGTTATNVRGKSIRFNSKKVIDDDPETYWATDDDVINASLTIDFGEETTFNRLLVQEYIPLGQRVKSFSVDAMVNGEWQQIAEETTIGYKRILRFDNVTANKIRLNVLDAKACPTISNIEIFRAPKLLEAPLIDQDKNGMVSMEAFDSELDIYYTLDQSQPDLSSMKYSAPFELSQKGVVSAMVYDPLSRKQSEVTTVRFDIPKAKWKPIFPSPRSDEQIMFVADANEKSVWKSDANSNLPQEIIIDLGEELTISGFTYLPTQQRYIDGTIAEYSFYVSKNTKNWGNPVSEGEFANIKNNPVLQKKSFDPVSGRYIKFKAIKEIKDQNFATVAELGIVTE